MSPDEQEARSRRYGNDVIMLLPLSSGRVAVFNRAGDLCGYVQLEGDKLWDIVVTTWHPPATSAAKPNPTLEELFSGESSPTTASARWQATLEAEKILDFVVDGKIGDDPSPSAVMDYTERAREITSKWRERYTFVAADGILPSLDVMIAAALSAIASEHQAALLEARQAWMAIEAHRNQLLAKLARLREPEMRDALKTRIGELPCGFGFSYPTPLRNKLSAEMLDTLADAALSVITEKLP